jgi:ubiquinone/menaquinone biosynthesis C-methylase UbiE
MENFSENYHEEKGIDKNEEIFQKYIEDLELTPEDFDKKILDIGAGNAGFAKWAKEHNVSSEIYSLDTRDEMEEKEKSVVGTADELPFKDESFDLIISACAVPNVTEVDQVEKTLLEAIRVVKPGGEIRLAKVFEGERYESQRIKKQELNKVLEKLKDMNLSVEKIRQPQGDLYEYDGHIKTDRLLSESYLIKIKKPNNLLNKKPEA